MRKGETMTVALSTRAALKEWAVTVRALERGDQVLLLRKGGIREEGKDFRLEHDEFLLYPTYEHQRPELIKPQFHADLAEAEAEGQQGRVPVRSWARVTHVFQTQDPEAVRRLAAHGVWTADYARERLNWKPAKPLYVLLLRAHLLREPRWIDWRAEYAGCKSWLELAEDVSLAGMRPVLDDAAYAQRLQEIESLL